MYPNLVSPSPFPRRVRATTTESRRTTRILQPPILERPRLPSTIQLPPSRTRNLHTISPSRLLPPRRRPWIRTTSTLERPFISSHSPCNTYFPRFSNSYRTRSVAFRFPHKVSTAPLCFGLSRVADFSRLLPPLQISALKPFASSSPVHYITSLCASSRPSHHHCEPPDVCSVSSRNEGRRD